MDFSTLFFYQSYKIQGVWTSNVNSLIVIRKTVCSMDIPLPNEDYIKANPNVLMPRSLVDWQTKRSLLFLQYFAKLINLLSTLLHQLSNYTCIKVSSAIYRGLRNNVDIFLVTESRDWPKLNIFKARKSQNILSKYILDLNRLAKYLKNCQPKPLKLLWHETSAFGKHPAKRGVGSPRDESVCGGVNGKSFFLSWQNFRVVLNPRGTGEQSNCI